MAIEKQIKLDTHGIGEACRQFCGVPNAEVTLVASIGQGDVLEVGAIISQTEEGSTANKATGPVVGKVTIPGQ